MYAAKTKFLVNNILLEMLKRNKFHKKDNLKWNVLLSCLTFIPHNI